MRIHLIIVGQGELTTVSESNKVTVMENAFAAIEFGSWSDLFGFLRGFKNWFYRGQPRSEWSLTSSLERVIGVTHGSSWNWKDTEKWMLRKFRGFAHQYLAQPPDDDDLLEWLALIQHHGAPTRLLDCTYSFPVAAYFAARDADTDFAIWAFNWNQFFKQVISNFQLKIDREFPTLDFYDKMHVKANEFLTSAASGALVFPTVPRRSNERLEVQQGMFLFPSDPARKFLENFDCLIGQSDIMNIDDPANLVSYDVDAHSFGLLREHWLLKCVLPKNERFKVLEDLHRMNIDGLVKSQNRSNRNYFHNFKFAVEYAKKSF